jgi:adenylate cyclase
VGDGPAPGANDFEAAGLYDPEAEDAPQRLALLEYLVELGATIDDLLAERDELPIVASTISLWPDRERFTLAQAAERSGLDADVIARTWRAAGFADVGIDQPFFTAIELQLLETLRVAIEFLGEEVTIQFVRVLGAASQRVADAAVSAFVVNVGPARMEVDPSGLELARANAASSALLPGLVNGFEAFMRHHLSNARRPLNTDVGRGVEVQQRSIGFADLVGSTGFAQELDIDKLAAAFTEFDNSSSELVVSHGGRVVKLIGDEVMFVAPDAATAADIALALVERFENHDVLPPVRAGVATGDVVARAGDYDGSVVNLAARAVKVASPSSLLVDQSTGDALPRDRFSRSAAGTFDFKGFAAPTPLFRIGRVG